MKEKVIDIYPSKERERRNSNISSEKVSRGGKKGILIALIFAILLGGYFYYASYQTRVVISPQTSEFSEERSILVRALGSVGEDEIRGAVLSETLSERREFPIKERKIIEENAQGEIRVCQDYNDSSSTYREGTRFVSDTGKLFLAKEGFVIPGRTNGDGCTVVEVIASQPGEDHNISSDAKFALPGLEGTNIYGRVKGESFTLTQEGSLEEVPYLGEEEMRQAEMEMGQDLLEKGMENIKEEHGEDYFLEKNAQFEMEVIERDMQENENDEDKFFFELTVDVKAITISKENTENFIENLLPEESAWRKDTEEIGYEFFRTNFQDQEADVVLSFSAEIYGDIDKETLKRDIVGDSFKEAKEKIDEVVNARDVQISTFPFGLSRVSTNLERIKIVLEFDKN